MTFPGYSRQSGPDPVNAQDLATKHYVDADWGVSAADLNTLTTGGTYIAADTNANAPPFPTGQYFLDVRHVGAVLQQRATHIGSPQYIATRFYNGTTWGGWHSPAAGLFIQQIGPPVGLSGAAGTFWTLGSGTPLTTRRYRVTLWFDITNNSGATESFVYFTLTDNQGAYTWPSGRIAWLGFTIGAGQSWYGSASHLWTPNSTAAVTWTVGFNGSGTPWVAGANSMEFTMEDMGTG